MHRLKNRKSIWNILKNKQSEFIRRGSTETQAILQNYNSLNRHHIDHDRDECQSDTDTETQPEWDQYCGHRCSIKTPLNSALVPDYLHETYWWAYTDPIAIRFWDRQWLANAILWGNFASLRNWAFMEIDKMVQTETVQKFGSLSESESEHHSSGAEPEILNILQIACVYGNFTPSLAHTQYRHKLTLIDISPIQLLNVKKKLDADILFDNNSSGDSKMRMKMNVELYQNNSANMHSIASNSQHITYLFFLLHEQPLEIRLQTIKEALRVTNFQDNGKLVIVDYHKPQTKWNPLLYVMYPILTYLEPYAIDLWRNSIESYIFSDQSGGGCNSSMSESDSEMEMEMETGTETETELQRTNRTDLSQLECTNELCFDGLYQKIVVQQKKETE